MTNKFINIIILPFKNKNNKYLDLLVSAIEDKKTDIGILSLKNDNLWNIFGHLKSGRFKNSENVLHIQWPTVLYGSKFVVKSFFLLLRNFFSILILKLIFNFNVVWTIHNFFAHDYPHPVLDTIGSHMVFRISDCVILQQQKTFFEYKNKYPKKNVRYVPHGNYIKAYGPITESTETIENLRANLGFSENDIVLVSLGSIAPYKLNKKIIEVVMAKRSSFPELKLLIIGKGDQKHIDELSFSALGDGGIVIKNQFVPDEEIANYLAVADYSIFYYDKSEMTSGGIILSLSYGVPVISRDIPGAEHVGNRNGLIFHDEPELSDILGKLTRETKKKHHRDIIQSISDQSWSGSAEKLIGIYRDLCDFGKK